MRHVLARHKYKILGGVPVLLLIATSLGFSGNSDTIALKPEERFLPVGATTTVSVQLHATQPVNVVGGSILLPSELSLVSVDTTDSLIDLWTDEPATSNTDVITFGGGIISEGGFTGSGEIFSIEVITEETGEAEILFSNPRVLAHDGKGTDVLDKQIPITFVIRNEGEPSPDLNQDNRVTIIDLGLISSKLFGPYDKRYDFNGDGAVSVRDMFILLSQVRLLD